MTSAGLLRGELRKLTSTKMPWVFLVVLGLVAALNAVAVVYGTDMDGSKTFISTASEQRSLVAFANNALMGASLFGAIAVAREYGHRTVVPTYLVEPRRMRAIVTQMFAVSLAGAALSAIGAALIVIAVALALPTTEYGFLVSAGAVAQVVGAAAFAGAAGATLGAGLGVLVRNVGGAVTATFLLLMVLPPLVVQLVSEAAGWVPASLAAAASGVTSEVGVLSALAGLAAWAIAPAAVGVWTVQYRDVV